MPCFPLVLTGFVHPQCHLPIVFLLALPARPYSHMESSDWTPVLLVSALESPQSQLPEAPFFWT